MVLAIWSTAMERFFVATFALMMNGKNNNA